MRTFLCFPIPKSFHKKNKKNTTRKNSAKVLDMSIWPGADVSSLKSEIPKESVKLDVPRTPSPASEHQLQSASPRNSVKLKLDMPRATTPKRLLDLELQARSLCGGSLVKEEQPILSPITRSQSETSFPVTEIEELPTKELPDESQVGELKVVPRSVKVSYVRDWVENLVEFVPKLIEESPLDQEETRSQRSESRKNHESLSLISQSKPRLNWIGAGLTTFPLLGSFQNLKELSLSKNSIVKIPRGALPRSLQILDLSFNKIINLDGFRGSGLNRLRVLNLSNNLIFGIGQALRECVSIRELYLNNNKVSRIDGLHKLRKLVFLDLSNNRLSSTSAVEQLAGNSETLLVLNLLHNPLMSKANEERVRRMVMDMAPRLTSFNKQTVKAGLTRDIVFGRFSKTSGPSGPTKKLSPTARARIRRAQSLEMHYLEASRPGTSSGACARSTRRARSVDIK